VVSLIYLKTLTLHISQIERQIAKFRTGAEKQTKEMTSELETWRQQEAKYIKLLSDHAESTKKAGEDIPEAKNRLEKVQSKIDTAAKDINEVSF
jgi:predicted  nucleic acid-binding Zn-ribbon protein